VVARQRPRGRDRARRPARAPPPPAGRERATGLRAQARRADPDRDEPQQPRDRRDARARLRRPRHDDRDRRFRPRRRHGRRGPHATFYVNGDVNDRSGGGRNGSRILGNFRIGQQPADDPIAHGTSVAGVAAGERWNASAAADRGHAPAAKLVGYAVADLPNGFASVTTLTNAWQRIATDAARFSIGVANCSYEGFATPQAMDQVAIDALAQAADIVIVGMAGNGGPSSLYGYGALNMLAVGAVENDNRRVAAFSSRGPLPGDPQRFYPDLVANGVDIIMPAADNEAGQRMAQGTSYSSPQVAGALYRSARPAASATEVKAAILATAENVSAQNPNPPYNSRNAYGHGYLRTDNLVFAALYGAHRDGVVTPTEPAARLTLPVTAGHEYAVGLAWFKQSSSSRNWSDLNLEIRDSNLIVLASSSTPRNTAEVVHFVAPTSGSVFAYVRAVGFENGQTAQPFSAVLADRTDTDGSLSSYGSSCDLSRLDPGDDPPSIGLSYSVEYRGRALTTAALLTGASDQVWLGRQLPFDLAPFGAPGCFVLTSTNVVLGIPVSSEGTGIVHLSVPFERSLIGVAVFHQALTFDPPRNPLGVVLSNGLRAVIGN
jgi:hypothetical protein